MAGRTWDEPANFTKQLGDKLEDYQGTPTTVIMMEDNGTEVITREWKLVVFADMCEPCDCCGEPICHVCDEHYAECDCPGPTQDGIIYEEFGNALYGREED
jgi:hypothetical protein